MPAGRQSVYWTAPCKATYFTVGLKGLRNRQIFPDSDCGTRIASPICRGERRLCSLRRDSVSWWCFACFFPWCKPLRLWADKHTHRVIPTQFSSAVIFKNSVQDACDATEWRARRPGPREAGRPRRRCGPGTRWIAASAPSPRSAGWNPQTRISRRPADFP